VITLDETQILSIIRERLSVRFGIEKIILFGSHATGQHHADSDWDGVVTRIRRIPLLSARASDCETLGRMTSPVDLLVYTPDEAREAGDVLGSAIYWAQNEGRVVYAK